MNRLLFVDIPECLKAESDVYEFVTDLTMISDLDSPIHGVVYGPPDSPYEGGRFRFRIYVPRQYPMVPPIVYLDTPIYHPNIDDNGLVCLNILKSDWNPVLTLDKVIRSLHLLLDCPNPDDALSPDIGNQLQNNPEAFKSVATKWTQMYAISTD